MNSNAGSTSYNGLTLTARLKMESTTHIAYTTNAISDLTLVFDPDFNGNVKLDGVNYSATDGLLFIPSVPSGSHVITKCNVANLYYIETAFTLGLNNTSLLQKIVLYPNPVSKIASINAGDMIIERITLYSLTGSTIKVFEGHMKQIDLTDLSSGSYFIRIQTDTGVITKNLLKE